MKDYQELVESSRRTHFSSPTVYEGVLKDGRKYLLSYRSGLVTFELRGSAVKFSRNYLSSTPASLSESSFKKLIVEFVKLLNTKEEKITHDGKAR